LGVYSFTGVQRNRLSGARRRSVAFVVNLSAARFDPYPVFSLALLLALVILLFVRGRWRSDWSVHRIRRAFREMDALDRNEASEADYRAPLGVVRSGLPPWAAAYALGRLANTDCPSRRRHLDILSQSDLSPFRERLVDLARDSTDPLAPEIWEVLTARHRSQWSKTLTDTDGRDGFADPPPLSSGPWCGYYVQLVAQHRMDLVLTFEKGSFRGEGTDVVGPFSISGRILDHGKVAATKSYSTHTVDYRGRVDGDGFAGRWGLFLGSGGFRFWPRRQPVSPPAVPKVSPVKGV
jgi:hypothetical protein